MIGSELKICRSCGKSRFLGKHENCRTCYKCGGFIPKIAPISAPRLSFCVCKGYKNQGANGGGESNGTGAVKHDMIGYQGFFSGKYTPSRVCHHIQDLFEPLNKLGGQLSITAGKSIVEQDWSNGKVPASATGTGKEQTLVLPNLGVYLDITWSSKLEKVPTKPLIRAPTEIDAFGGAVLPVRIQRRLSKYIKEKEAREIAVETIKNLPKEYHYPFLLVHWPDHGVIEVDEADDIVRMIIDGLKKGQHIDIGCVGAHGRTGTLLAMIMIDALSMTAKEAIECVRKDHCDEAIESADQVRAIFGFSGKLAIAEEVNKLLINHRV